MRKSTAVLIVAVVVAVLVGLRWKRRASHAPAPAAVAQGSAHAVPSATPADPAKRAHAIASVTDANGAISGATVRFAESDGEIAIARTGADGTATIDLAPGKWRASASATDHEPAAVPARELREGQTERFELVLVTGGRPLTGVVHDASGGPVAGARIDAAKLGGMVRPTEAIASTTTGADGKYAMTVAEGQLLVAASDPDYAPQSRYVEVGPSGATADFHLVPGGVIEGIVHDEHSRQPVGGALVSATRDAPAMMLGEQARHRATAGPDGKFRISGLRPGSYELAATAGKLASHAPTIVGLGVAEQVTDVEILVGAGPVIRGFAVDEAGAPAPGVSIQALTGDGEAVEETADPKGAFEISGLAPGRYMLIGRGGGDFIPKGSTEVELATKDVEGVKVTVRHGSKVKGHVEPRQICDVRLDIDDHSLGPDMPMIAQTITTAPDGEFSIGPVSPVKYTIDARCASGDQGTLAVQVMPALPEQIVRVAPGASITGRVVDAAGKPVGGVAVMAARQAGGEHTMIVNGMVTSGAQALTTAAGAFELRGLAAGPYQLRVLDRGRPLVMRSPEAATKVSLAATDHKTGVELAIDRADGVIKGTVTGADGKPLADAWVSVHQDIGDLVASMERRGAPEESESRFITVQNTDDGGDAGGGEVPPALTDANGQFEIGGLTRQPWTVVAEAQAGKLRGRQTSVTPDATVAIQALGVTSLSGTVHAASGTPASFAVELDGPTRAQRSFASPDGAFSFGRVDPGAYKVRVTSSAGNGEASVVVEANKAATVEVQLDANAIVIGKLVDAAGKPLADIGVTVIPDSGDGSVRVSLTGPPPTSGPDGTFRVETKAGKSILVAMTPRPTTKRGLVLEPGKTFDAGTITVAGAPPKP